MIERKLTPLWCSHCRMYVPAEREPHISLRHDRFHYADFASMVEADRWKRDHPEDDPEDAA